MHHLDQEEYNSYLLFLFNEGSIVRSCCYAKGGVILTVGEYLLVTAYAPMYAYRSFLGLYSCLLLQCIILIKRKTIITCVAVLRWFYSEKLLLC
jgi:hypothetical protein